MQLDVGLNKHLDKLGRFLLRIINLTAITRGVHATCKALLLLVPIIMRVVLDRLLLDDFIIIRLFDDLPALLLARGEKVLDRDVVLWLNLDLLLVVENRYRVTTSIVKSAKLRCFHLGLSFGNFMGILFGLLLICMNQIMNMAIFMSQMFMIVLKWHQAFGMRSVEANGGMKRMHSLL